MTLLIFLLILSFLVLIHELGHFVMARRSGVRVEEFGIGYPPRAVRLFTDKHGTDYTLNFLPFGGFVRLYGEETPESGDGVVEEDARELFYRKPKRVRLAIIVAGAVINFLFGAVAFGAIYTKTGIPTPLEYVKVDEVVSASPAEAAGLVAGDKILGITPVDEFLTISSVDQFVNFLREHRGQEIVLDVERDGERIHQPIYVRSQEETPEGQGAIGVAISDIEFRHYPLWQMPFRGMWVGLRSAVGFGWFLLGALGGMVRDLVFFGVVPKEVAGPVGIVYVAQKEGLLTSGWLSILNFSAVLSINLAIVNLLPFPALDGGRALFVLIEGVFGKPIKPGLERWANGLGMGLLLLLIVLISIRDIRTVVGEQMVWERLQGWFGR